MIRTVKGIFDWRTIYADTGEEFPIYFSYGTPPLEGYFLIDEIKNGWRILRQICKAIEEEEKEIKNITNKTEEE